MATGQTTLVVGIDPKSMQPVSPDLATMKQRQYFVRHMSITGDQIDRYMQASGDGNPVHRSDEIGKWLGFEGGRIAHGMLLWNLAEAALRQYLNTSGQGWDPLKPIVLKGRFQGIVHPAEEVSFTVQPKVSAAGSKLQVFALKHGKKGELWKVLELEME
jgi:acyl dehydratase